MRRLLVMRHAKSDWGDASLTDHDRPLATRGERAARRMGAFLAATATVPQLVLTSSAVRARRTAELAAGAGDWQCPITVEPDLYDADPARVLAILTQLDRDTVRVMVVGHEPTLSGVLHALTGAVVRFPTAAVACVTVDRDSWRSLDGATAELRWLVTPKLLRHGVRSQE